MITFEIKFSGEPEAGLIPYSDEVVISCESEYYGDIEEFAEFMRESLEKWYDGAKVTVKSYE